MPWEAKDAERFTKKAQGDGDAEEWASIANGVLKDTGDEGKAIRIANAHVAKKHGKKKGKSK